MDKIDVKACIRALISSTPIIYNLHSLLDDFKKMFGVDLPLFGYNSPIEFLQSLSDTVKLVGNPRNPNICLVESKKSAHIISLVDRQKTKQIKSPRSAPKPKRIVFPLENDNLNWSKTRNSIRDDQNRISMNSSYYNDSNIPELSSKEKLNPNLKNVKSSFLSTNNTWDYFDENFFHEIENNKVENTAKNSETELSNSCYFEDSESCVSTGDSSSGSSSNKILPSSCSYINDGMKNKLKTLIKNYSNGLWCCDLPKVFKDMFNFELNYQEFGYTSLIQMLSELPDVFRCVRPANEDWILFDASSPPSPIKKEMIDVELSCNIAEQIKNNLRKLLCQFEETSDSVGIELNKILCLYEKTFGTLDFLALGFKDFRSLIESLNGTFFNMYDLNNVTVIVPRLQPSFKSQVKQEQALPPITAEDDIFRDIFPRDVVRPDENLLDLDLSRHIAVDQLVEVCAAEVWSPDKFYLQLNKFKNKLTRFMNDLQGFYNVHLKKFKMSDATIRPKQVCVGLYNSDPEYPEEWHRAKILKVINDKMVSVNFVDYGTVTHIRKSRLRFLHRCFQSFPAQAFQAKLAGVAPLSDDTKWPPPVCKKFLDLLRVPYLEAKIVDVDFEKSLVHVILYNVMQKPVVNINEKLILENCAKSIKTGPQMSSLLFTKGENNEMTENPSTNKRDELQNSDCILEEKQENTFESTLSYEFDEILDLYKFETKTEINEENDKNFLSMSETLRPEKPSPPSTQVTSPKKYTRSVSTQTCKTDFKSDFSAVSKNLPPGLENYCSLIDVEHLKTLFVEQQLETIKKQLNFLAMQLLTTNLKIKEIGLWNPELALKISMQIAENYVHSSCTNEISDCAIKSLDSLILGTPSNVTKGDVTTTKDADTVASAPEVTSHDNSTVLDNPFNVCDENQIPTTNEPEQKDSQSDTKTYKFVKKVKICDKELHAVNIDGETYLCVEEIIQSFTTFANKEDADKLLRMKKINFEYKILAKNKNGEILNELESCNVPKIVKQKNKKKMKVFLLTINDVVSYLKVFSYINDNSNVIKDLAKLLNQEVKEKS